ncbi:PilX N-terminal domain-containing pilus assembly protein [Oceanicoccus sp. KOV_DT_Chl]|uniref:PilX N-terminal domain-containing pilus assembly protein n=1 Tax=Oceanicoccus sp. KOV_DT_Chl TaxID=1904639 RepID=UPI000C7A2397|nr:PilX N-terminal domain-containing pilus assembly protein [Oceanicoccus sp. KOV_DT_Chl]
MQKSLTHSYTHSQGAILIVSLILLLVMTLIGVASIDSSQLQSQMASNSLHQQNQYQRSLNEIRAQQLDLNRPARLSTVTASTTTFNATKGITTKSVGISIADNEMLTGDSTDAYDQYAFIVFSGDSVPPPVTAWEIISAKTMKLTWSQKFPATVPNQIKPKALHV